MGRNKSFSILTVIYHHSLYFHWSNSAYFRKLEQGESENAYSATNENPSKSSLSLILLAVPPDNDNSYYGLSIGIPVISGTKCLVSDVESSKGLYGV